MTLNEHRAKVKKALPRRGAPRKGAAPLDENGQIVGQAEMFDVSEVAPVIEPRTVSRNEPSHGETLKSEGIEKALSKGGLDDWQDKVKAWTWRLSAGTRFTSEDVTAEFGLPTGEVKTNKNNAVGAIMNAIATKGVIQNTGDYVKSSRPSSHSAVIAVWERTQLGKESRGSNPDLVPVPTHQHVGPTSAGCPACDEDVQHTCHPSGISYSEDCDACLHEWSTG